MAWCKLERSSGQRGNLKELEQLISKALETVIQHQLAGITLKIRARLIHGLVQIIWIIHKYIKVDVEKIQDQIQNPNYYNNNIGDKRASCKREPWFKKQKQLQQQWQDLPCMSQMVFVLCFYDLIKSYQWVFKICFLSWELLGLCYWFIVCMFLHNKGIFTNLAF